MNVIKTDKWTAKVLAEDIQIDDFTFKPGEAKKITSLLGFAGSMSELKALPPEIEDTPYKVEFSDDGSLTLVSGKSKLSGFKFEDVDDLIVLINNMVQVLIDTHTLRPHARGKVAFSSLPGNVDID
jgi:hypothetical protein